MIRRPPRSTLFPSRRSSDLEVRSRDVHVLVPDVARLDRGGQLDVGVRPVAGLATQIGQEPPFPAVGRPADAEPRDRKSTRLNSSHLVISYAVFCLKKKKTTS